MQPAVSVITTIYNTAPFLDQAVRSILTQTFPDWQLLLVDDGSTDGSQALAQNWCCRDPRISFLTHPLHGNRGISASRNLGIRASTGSLIAFLDADDVWFPGKLEVQLAVLAAHPEAAMTFGAAERWYSWDTFQPGARDFVVPSVIPGWGTDCILPPPVLLEAFLREESLTPCTCSVLIRRPAVLRAGGFEESFRGLYDDQVFYAKLSLAEPVYVSRECVARYRQHELSCCASSRREGTGGRAREAFLAWLDNYRSVCMRSR